jgi:uncharacterized membrane protein YwzB
MNPFFILVAVYAALTAIRRRWFIKRERDHAALVCAEVMAVCLGDLHALLEAIDAEMARRHKA